LFETLADAPRFGPIGVPVRQAVDILRARLAQEV
jgi:hypothetical protein